MRSCLMPIRHADHASVAPLVCVHGEFVQLARDLQRDRSVYALNYVYRMNSVEDGPDDVRVLAREYVTALIARQPTGPYCLYGFCTGAVIAYEMARLLEAGGHTVAHLCLASPPFNGESSMRKAGKALGAIGRGQLSAANVSAFIGSLVYMVRILPAVLAIRLRTRWHGGDDLPPDLLSEHYLTRLRPSMRAYIYKSLRCSRVEIIYGDCDDKTVREATTFWSAVVGRPVAVHSFTTNGKHMDMVDDPAVRRKTAELLDASVCQAS